MTQKPETTTTRYEDLKKRFSSPENDYNLLRGDQQAIREQVNVWDSDFVKEKYIQATDKMVGMLDGSIDSRYLYDPEDPEKSKQRPDVVVWLDKSARPVSWFVDAFWEQFAKPGAKKPDYDFLNIDRENWFVRQGHKRIDASYRLGPADFDIDAVSDEDIARIRAIFTEGEIDKGNWQSDVWNLPTRLDDKNILIIDEVKNKGGTLAIAAKLLKRAIPTATVSGDYFWKSGNYALGGNADKIQMESAPVWYNADDSYGRGVGEISQAYHDNMYEKNPSAENFRRKLGWIALSAPHFNPIDYSEIPDHKADQLKQDIAYLTYGGNFRNPSLERTDEDWLSIVADQGISVEELKTYIRGRSEENKV